MSSSDRSSRTTHTSKAGSRWGSLSFRLGLAINVSAIFVLAAFGFVDYQRERSVHLDELGDRLRQEGRVLRTVYDQLGMGVAFDQYLDNHCQQMDAHISPGHHLLLADAAGTVIARAHTRPDADLESKMISGRSALNSMFLHAGDEYMAAGIPTADDMSILVAQSLTPVKRMIHRQAISRVVSVSVLVALVLAVTNLLLSRWVRRPIQALVQGVDAVRQGRFDHRVPELDTAELQFLGSGFNRMNMQLAASEERRRQEMDKARRLHLALLPPASLEIPGLTWAARYIPADTIGGDYYEMLRRADGRWLLLVADVAGHGVAAALATALLKALIRQSVRQNGHLPAMLAMLNAELESLTGADHFVTCLAMVYDPASGTIEYANCGHEAGVLLDEAGRCKAMMSSTGLPLGIDSDAAWEVRTVKLEEGDVLCLVTDGLADVPDRKGSLLGRNRVVGLLQETVDPSPHRQVDSVVRQASKHAGDGPFEDDVTVIIFRRVQDTAVRQENAKKAAARCIQSEEVPVPIPL